MGKYPKVTKKIAAQLLRNEIGSTVGLVRAEDQTPGGRYEAERGRLHIEIETNWYKEDPGHFVVRISDCTGASLSHYYWANTLQEDIQMECDVRQIIKLEDMQEFLINNNSETRNEAIDDLQKVIDRINRSKTLNLQ